MRPSVGITGIIMADVTFGEFLLGTLLIGSQMLENRKQFPSKTENLVPIPDSAADLLCGPGQATLRVSHPRPYSGGEWIGPVILNILGESHTPLRIWEVSLRQKAQTHRNLSPISNL